MYNELVLTLFFVTKKTPHFSSDFDQLNFDFCKSDGPLWAIRYIEE